VTYKCSGPLGLPPSTKGVLFVQGENHLRHTNTQIKRKEVLKASLQDYYITSNISSLLSYLEFKKKIEMTVKLGYKQLKLILT
jgi:hypothetical protein